MDNGFANLIIIALNPFHLTLDIMIFFNDVVVVVCQHDIRYQ